MILWSRFAGGAAGARFHRPGREHGDEVVAFQHDAVRRLGRFVAGVPSPHLIRSLPDGSGANVLAEPGGEVVVQLLGGAEGERIAVDLPPGPWMVRWLDPARGEEIGGEEIVAGEGPVRLTLPSELDHRILHLRPIDAPATE